MKLYHLFGLPRVNFNVYFFILKLFLDQRKVRGPTLLTDIWNLSEDERVFVDFNKRWQAIGKEGRVLASFLGIVARNANLTPLHIPDWRAFPMKEKRNILKLVKVRKLKSK